MNLKYLMLKILQLSWGIPNAHLVFFHMFRWMKRHDHVFRWTGFGRPTNKATRNASVSFSAYRNIVLEPWLIEAQFVDKQWNSSYLVKSLCLSKRYASVGYICLSSHCFRASWISGSKLGTLSCSIVAYLLDCMSISSNFGLYTESIIGSNIEPNIR